MMLRVAGIEQDSIVDGPGLRLAIFCQGCPHACPDCHNKQTWPFTGGTLMEIPALVRLAANNPLCQGVTLSGGEPFAQAAACAEIARQVRAAGKDVWAYTGYTLQELIDASQPDWNALLTHLDALVDGKFIASLKTLNTPFIGSSNQRIWHREGNGWTAGEERFFS